MIADGCRGAGGKKLTGRSGRWGLAQSLATPPSSAHSPSQASRPSWGALLLLCLDPRLQDHPQGPSPSWRGQGKPQGRGCIPECLHTHGPSLPSRHPHTLRGRLRAQGPAAGCTRGVVATGVVCVCLGARLSVPRTCWDLGHPGAGRHQGRRAGWSWSLSRPARL